MRIRNITVHYNRHELMLDFQKEIRPFTPTIKELMRVWDVKSTNTVLHSLRFLEARKMVVTRAHGSVNSYYAVKK